LRGHAHTIEAANGPYPHSRRQPLSGRLPISGAKNAALTLMPCALLTEEPVTLRNLPRLADVDSFGHLLNQLGARPRSRARGRRISAGS
jgi:UDP-N-acetylglucosamine enolpyruvyl transferase